MNYLNSKWKPCKSPGRLGASTQSSLMQEGAMQTHVREQMVRASPPGIFPTAHRQRRATLILQKEPARCSIMFLPPRQPIQDMSQEAFPPTVVPQ